MGKTIDIPDNISKTQFVEEVFRNIKDAPVHNKDANTISFAKSLDEEIHDVVSLKQAKPYDKIDEDENSNQPKQEDAANQEKNDSSGKQPDDETEKNDDSDSDGNPPKMYSQKGLLLDIEG